MREIKFRAWEPLNKSMLYLDFALYKFEGVGVRNSHKFALPIGKQMLQNPYTYMNLDAVTVMQYTGLKDKNGKEIYEGDIVKQVYTAFNTFEENEFLGFVKYGEGSYDIENFEGTDGRYLFNEIQELEVIGNIYENPELLPEVSE